jgi:hypothetical protein
VLFEAGALAKSLDGAKVIPLLFGLELRDISGPLAQFQAKKFDESGLSEVANSINKSLQSPVPESTLKTLLDAMWPRVRVKLEEVPKAPAHVKSSRTQTEVLEELLAGVRGFDFRLKEAEFLFSEQGSRSKRRRPRFLMPMLLDMIGEIPGSDPVGILVMAGLLREELPWYSEVLASAYQDIRKGGPRGGSRAIRRSVEQLHSLTKAMSRYPLADEFGISKDYQMLVQELPKFLEHYLIELEMRNKFIIRTEIEEEDEAGDEPRTTKADWP